MNTDYQSILDQLIPQVQVGSRIALQLRGQGLQTWRKRDTSIVTNADLQIEQLLTDSLKQITPSIPVVGEEGTGWHNNHDAYWLIDPIDGTSEYVKGSHEFGICVSLIEHHKPTLGVVALPAEQQTFVGIVPLKQAYVQDLTGAQQQIQCRPLMPSSCVVLHSRTENPTRFAHVFEHEIQPVAMSSVRKFTQLAQGKADFYVRSFGLCEYDIAAGDALVQAAGGTVCTWTAQPIEYGGDRLFVPGFLISGSGYLPRSIRMASGANPSTLATA